MNTCTWRVLFHSMFRSRNCNQPCIQFNRFFLFFLLSSIVYIFRSISHFLNCTEAYMYRISLNRFHFYFYVLNDDRLFRWTVDTVPPDTIVDTGPSQEGEAPRPEEADPFLFFTFHCRSGKAARDQRSE